MTYALDTNIVSYILRRQEDVIEKLEAEINKGNSVVIPPIVYYEVRRGLLASNAVAKAVAFEVTFADLSIDAIDKETLDRSAVEYARLRKAGQTIQDADLFIAEYCVQNGFTLVTNNIKHFEIVRNLKCVNWVQ
jgi:predicted nucleic acid-binding protein